MVIPIAVGFLVSCQENQPAEPVLPKPVLTLQETEVSVVTSDAIGPTYQLLVRIPFTVNRNGVSGPIQVTTDPASAFSSWVEVPDTGSTFVGFVSYALPMSIPIGDHTVNLVATGGGSSVSQPFTIHILAFRSWLVARRVVLSQGATQRVSVGIKVSGGAGATSIAVKNLPPGVTVSGPPSSPLIFEAAVDAPIRSARVTVEVTAGSRTEAHEFELMIQVPQPKRPIAFRICWPKTQLGLREGFLGGPMAFANDGEGWTNATPDADDVVRFEATERVSIAVSGNGSGTYAPGPFVRVIHATATELEQMQCARSNGSKVYRSKIENAERYTATVGAFQAYLLGPATTRGVAAAGPRDLIAAGTRTAAGTTQRLVVLRRGVDLPNNDTVRVDFAGAEPISLDSATYDVAGAATVVTRLHTATTIGSLAGAYPGTASGWYWSVPEALLGPDEIQSLLLTTTEAPTTRGYAQYFRTAAPVSASFGPAVATPTVDTAAGIISLPSQAEYPDIAGVAQRYVLDYRGVYADVEVWKTRGYEGGTPAAWTFSAPDWGPGRPWLAVNVSAAAASTNGGSPGAFFGASPAAGTSLRWSVTNRGFMAAALPFPAER